jgi:hypothetical protein
MSRRKAVANLLRRVTNRLDPVAVPTPPPTPRSLAYSVEELVTTLREEATQIAEQVGEMQLTGDQTKKIWNTAKDNENGEIDREQIDGIISEIREQTFLPLLRRYLETVKKLQVRTGPLTFDEWMEFETGCQAGFSALKEVAQLTLANRVFHCIFEYHKFTNENYELLKGFGVDPNNIIEE